MLRSQTCCYVVVAGTMKTSQIRVTMLVVAFIVLAVSVQAAETATRPSVLDGALRAFGRMRKLLQVAPTPGAGVSRASEVGVYGPRTGFDIVHV